MAVKNELSAGGIVYRKTNNGSEVLLIKDHRGKWTFPKGHVEGEEDPKDAALRETAEETGLADLVAQGEVGKIDYWFKQKWDKSNDLVHKTVRYYLLEAPANAEPQPPQDWSAGVEPISDAKWHSMDEAKQRSGYKDNTRLLQRAIELLERTRQSTLLK